MIVDIITVALSYVITFQGEISRAYDILVGVWDYTR